MATCSNKGVTNMRDYPKNVLRVYDHPKFSDRFTVYFNKKEREYYSCIVMSENPFHPQGIGQHSCGMLGRHNGKIIDFKDLPLDCQTLVTN